MDIHQGINSHYWCSSLPNTCDNSLRRYEHKSTKTNNRVTTSFQTSTYYWELHGNSALRLECSHTAIDLGIFALDTRFHNARVTENDEG